MSLVEPDDVALAAMGEGDDANAVGLFNRIRLHTRNYRHPSAGSSVRRTFLVVTHARAPEFHLVIKKLRACPAPRDTQARKVHSSLTSHSSYLT